jgi:hypothetical protein
MVSHSKLSLLIGVLISVGICSCGQDGGVSPTLVTTPTGSTDCNPCRIFLTATTTTGDVGVAGFDAICTSDANKPATGTYKAFAVDSSTRVACTTANCSGGPSEHTDWVLHGNTDYTRVDSTIIGRTDTNGLWIFPLTNAIAANSDRSWTGFESTVVDWRTEDVDNCSNWSSLAGVGYTSIHSGTIISSVLAFNIRTCNTQQFVTCVEQ